MAGMDAEMHEAFERAVHTSTGYFRGAPEAVLARLAEMGIAHREDDDEDYFLTDKGWDLGSLPDHVSSSGIKYRVANTARWEIPIELVDPVPDTRAPGFPMVRPNSVTISLTPNRAGNWCVSSAAVWGPKVKDGKVTTKREYSTLFSDLMDAFSETPQWLREICQDWADRANGWVVPEPPKEREPIQVREPVKEVSPQRAAFDTALRVLLIRENLDGAEWAIEQIRKMAEGPELGAEGLRHIADHLEGLMDMRTAELSTRHWRD